MHAPPLALYVHLPWCERKCPYCDFNSHERAVLPEDAYVDALLEDLDQEFSAETRPLESIFIGGGTPSLFRGAAIGRLLDGIRDRHGLDGSVEVTMEANPGSAESDRLAAYAEAGVTRFSIGIQSFDDDSLQALGRIHDGAQAARAIEAARRSGARSFNLDLMHGLPGQTPARGLDDLQRAIDAGAPHLSWYQLTIEPNTRFYSSPPRLPADESLGELEEKGMALLRDAGYERYEVSAWAQPGAECRHNLNYWRFGDYRAIGAGAHGKVTDTDGVVTRYAKTRRPEDYMAEHGTRRVGERTLDSQDLRGEFAMNALRLGEGFSLDLYEARTGLRAEDLGKVLDTLQADDLVRVRDGRVRTTATGLRFLDDVVGRFFATA